jgi:hypothetical protein
LNRDEPTGRDLAYDSGSSAKLIRFGVERPDDGVLPVIRATPLMINPEVEGDEGEVVVGVGGAEGLFKDECRGGDGGRVDEW